MKTIVTKSGLDLLKEKLAEKIEHLRTIREEKAIAYSVSGDGWHDNPGWTQLGQQEEQLAYEVNILQQKIWNVVIVDSSKMDTNKVQIGSFVEFFLINSIAPKNEVQRFQIVGSGESDVKNKKLSYDSPIGKALCNMKTGEEKEVQLPGGRIKIKIKNIHYE